MTHLLRRKQPPKCLPLAAIQFCPADVSSHQSIIRAGAGDAQVEESTLWKTRSEAGEQCALGRRRKQSEASLGRALRKTRCGAMEDLMRRGRAPSAWPAAVRGSRVGD